MGLQVKLYIQMHKVFLALNLLFGGRENGK